MTIYLSLSLLPSLVLICERCRTVDRDRDRDRDKYIAMQSNSSHPTSDKRFQTDAYFPLVAFNHEQMKSSSTDGYLLAEKDHFDDVAQSLMDIDLGTLKKLSNCLSKRERVKPETPEEKACYTLS